MKTVLVAGATGYLGRYLLQALRERGYAVRALVRSPHKLQAEAAWLDQVDRGRGH